VHESTRRSLCRLLFVLFALAPTSGVLGWIAWRERPGRLAEVESAMCRQLGAKVTLARCSSPQPGVTVFAGVELHDRETGQLVARARRVTLDDRGPVRLAELLQLEVVAAELPAFWRRFEERLLRDAESQPIQIIADGVTLAEPKSLESNEGHGGLRPRLTLSNVLIGVERHEQGQRAAIAFHLPEAGTPSTTDNAEPIRIHVERTHGPQVATKWRLDCRHSRFPLAMLDGLLPATAALGPDCQFQGSLWMARTDSSGRFAGSVSGRFTNINLDRLVSRRFAHKLSGAATLTLQHAEFKRGRVTRAAGVLSGGAGVLSRSLLSAAAEHLGCRAAPGGEQAAQTGVYAEYERLTVQFELDASGNFLLAGHPETGAILTGEQSQPLLLQPRDSRHTTTALLRTLAPAGRLWAPVSRETETLLPWIPLSSARQAAPGAGAGVNPRHRIRLGTGTGDSPSRRASQEPPK